MATISPLSFTITSTNHKSHKQYTHFRPNPSQPIKFLHLGTSKFRSFHQNKRVGVLRLSFLMPIVGLGALFWWAGRDMIKGTCPNCGNDFQILKFTLNEDVQLCPYCSQPFSVVGDEFVSDPVKFSNSSTPFEQPFSGFSPRSKKGKDVKGVVDIEAEVKDVE
ncbi:hypothetical protein Drorol1_Dr00015028 [Drosera rotundifolia]